MHGFNQGQTAITELIENEGPDIFMLQEHWLTPANLCKFDVFSDYFCFGCSAMTKQVESGLLIGRPFGGVAIMVKKELRSITKTVHCDDRYAIITVSNYVLINVYMPCSGTPDRSELIENLLADISSWCDSLLEYHFVIAGDFNTNLCIGGESAAQINSFINDRDLVSCDTLFGMEHVSTYVNEALNQASHIDYVLSSRKQDVVRFSVIDLSLNFSDHLPVMVEISCRLDVSAVHYEKSNGDRTEKLLRWDKGDIMAYYFYTGHHLQLMLNDFDSIVQDKEHTNFSDRIELIYNSVISILSDGARLAVPTQSKSFYKYWWDEELDLLRQTSIDSNNVWVAAGKPRSGPIFTKRQTCRRQYRLKIKEKDTSNTVVYTNKLHEALLSKNGTSFWTVWRSKFE